MLTLITGTPGAGKSLYTLGVVEALRKETGREVYYHNIRDLALPWHSIAHPDQWMSECPDGAIVVLDECQMVFRQRTQTSAVPAHVAPLETHRHRGLDFFLITQNPGLIDSHVRKLCGRHIHLERRYGRTAAKTYQWEQAVSDPTRKAEQLNAVKGTFNYPAEHFSWYKSAEVHTVRKDFPWKLYGLVAVLAVAAVAVFSFAFFRARHMGEELLPEPVTEAAAGERQMVRTVAGPDPWAPEVRRPRLATVPQSSAYYDGLIGRPVSAPRIAGCAEMVYSDGVTWCTCHDQQGVKIDMDIGQCRMALKVGMFDPLRRDEEPNADVIRRLDAYAQAAMGDGRGVVASGASNRAAPEPAASGGGDLAGG